MDILNSEHARHGHRSPTELAEDGIAGLRGEFLVASPKSLVAEDERCRGIERGFSRSVIARDSLLPFMASGSGA